MATSDCCFGRFHWLQLAPGTDDRHAPGCRDGRCELAVGTPTASYRVAIAHDWLVRYGGAERCLDEMLVAYPDADLYASVIDSERVPDLYGRARPSFLQRIPGAKLHHEVLLPLMPLAWRARRALTGYDVVISSSYACAKAVRVASGVPHICYCHTPIRYAWSFDEERLRFPRALRGPARFAMGAFRRWDRSTSARVSLFIANSSAVAARIAQYYGRRARVIHPPVDTDFYTPAQRKRNGFLYVGRLTGYKRPDLVVDAFAGLEHRLTVVGSGPMLNRLRAAAPANVRFLPSVTREELRQLYRSSEAMVYPVNEDFGIAMAEAQACGTPVIGLAAGGALDIVEPGSDRLARRSPSGRRDPLRRDARGARVARSSYIADKAARFSAERFRREFGEIVSGVVRGTIDEGSVA